MFHPFYAVGFKREGDDIVYVSDVSDDLTDWVEAGMPWYSAFGVEEQAVCLAEDLNEKHPGLKFEVFEFEHRSVMNTQQVIEELNTRYGQDNWHQKPCIERGQVDKIVVGVLHGPVHIEVEQTEANWWEVNIWSDFNDCDICGGSGATLTAALDEAGDEFAAAVDNHIRQFLDLKKTIGHL